MSKEEVLKIQKCVLKVNIHCDGCKQKVKKILQKIDGVFTTDIDADQGKVTVAGNVDAAVLIKKLAKSGKHAELWGTSKPNNNNQKHLANQFKNMQIDAGKGGGGNNNKGQKGGNNQPKGGQQERQHQLLQQQHQLQQQQQQFQQQLQQLQQMKGLQDLNLHPFKDLKMPGQNPNQKAVKFNLPDDDDLTDDEFDEFDDEDYDDDFDDEFVDPELPLNKMKTAMPNGQRPNMMLNGMTNGQHPQLRAAQKAGSVGGNGMKGGSGPVAVPIKVNYMNGANNGKNENGVKQRGSVHGGGGGNNQSQSGGKQNGGKNGGFKNGNNGGGANNKNNSNSNAGAHGNSNGNGGKKFNGTSEGPHPHPMSNVFQNMNEHPAMAAAAAKMGTMGNMNNMPMAQMGNMSMGQMGSIPAVQGLPAAAMNGGDGYFKGGAAPDVIAGDPYHQQQQYLAAIMNQQRAMGNDRFQPMMYARPPPAVNYMPPYPYTPHPPADPYTHYFSDENTTSTCSVM